MRNANAIKSESTLVRKATGGNADAFVELVQKHQTLIYRISLKLLRNREDAEDNLQNTMFKAFRRIRQFNRNSQFSTWLTRIAINEALMFLRAARNQKSHFSLNAAHKEDALPFELAVLNSPEVSYINKDLAAKGLQELTPNMKDLVLLRIVEGCTSKEIGELVGIPEARAKARIFRARAIMRQKLESLDYTGNGSWNQSSAAMQA